MFSLIYNISGCTIKEVQDVINSFLPGGNARVDSACSVVRGKDHVIQAIEHFSNMGFILEHVQGGPGAGSGLGRGLDANDGTGPVAAALMLLQQLGASDDD